MHKTARFASADGIVEHYTTSASSILSHLRPLSCVCSRGAKSDVLRTSHRRLAVAASHSTRRPQPAAAARSARQNGSDDTSSAARLDVIIRQATSSAELRAAAHLRAASFYSYPVDRSEFSARVSAGFMLKTGTAQASCSEHPAFRHTSAHASAMLLVIRLANQALRCE